MLLFQPRMFNFVAHGNGVGAVQTGSAEVSEVRRIVKLSIQRSSDVFAVANRNSGKIFAEC